MINLVLAVDDMIKFGNFSAVFAPVIEDKNFFSESPMMALRRGNFKKVFSKIKIFFSMTCLIRQQGEKFFSSTTMKV